MNFRRLRYNVFTTMVGYTVTVNIAALVALRQQHQA
jgi:hypothetical protein